MRTLLAITAALLVTSCGGGGGGSGTTTGDTENNGCSQEFYQTMFGRYSGVIELNSSNRAPRMCQWESTIEFTGDSIGPRCFMRATTTGIVTQSTFYPDDITDRYQCIEEQGERTVREPVGGTFPINELPGLDNSYFPIDVDFSVNDSADRGPYFGDESINSAYVNLYDGTTSQLVKQITIGGDGTITIRDTNGVLLGTLIKE